MCIDILWSNIEIVSHFEQGIFPQISIDVHADYTAILVPIYSDRVLYLSVKKSLQFHQSAIWPEK